MPSQQNRPNKKKKKITGNVQPEKVHKTLLKWVLFILVGVIVYTLYLLLIPKDIDLFKTTVAAKQGSLEVYYIKKYFKPLSLNQDGLCPQCAKVLNKE